MENGLQEEPGAGGYHGRRERVAARAGHGRAWQAGAGLGAVLSKANSAVGNAGLGRVRDPTFWPATVL